MKKLVKVFALAAVMMFGAQAMAQTSGTMFLSASFPMGNYGKGEIVNLDNNWALVNSDLDNRYAGASIGANVGLKWKFGLGVPGLGVMLSLDGFYNGLNNDLKEYFDERVIHMNNDPLVKSYTLNRPKFINVPLMVGLNQTFYLTPSFGIYLEGGLGCNARFITQYSEEIQYVAIATATTAYKYKPAFSFAYQFGTGFEISKKFVIGASFYDLGGSKVVAERTQLVTDMYKNEKGVRPMMVLVRIGFKF